MVWTLKDKETVIKKCFAIFPKRIGNCVVWLAPYYKTWDYSYQGIYSGYMPHLFVEKDDAVSYINNKRRQEDVSLFQ